MLFTTFMVKHKLRTYYEIVIFFSDNDGKLVANITKWWDGPQQRTRPNAYVIDVYNQGTSGEDRLTAMQKTALIGATLLIEFAYYIPEGRYFPEPKPTEPELTEPERPEPERTVATNSGNYGGGGQLPVAGGDFEGCNF